MDRLKDRLSSGSSGAQRDPDGSLKGKAKAFLSGFGQQSGAQGASIPSNNSAPAATPQHQHDQPQHQHHPHTQPQPQAEPQLRTGDPVVPKVKGQPQLLGLVGDPSLNRDSGGSARFGDRVLWTYRDTQLCGRDGKVQALPIITSTASWTDLDPRGTPSLQNVDSSSDKLNTTALRQYGDTPRDCAYFPIFIDGSGTCAGERADGSRHPFWPDQPPMVTETTNEGKVTAYTWIRQEHLKGLTNMVENPATTLYRLDYKPSWHKSKDALPKVSIVHQNFWQQGELAFGNYGNVVKDGIAYLYAQAKGVTALAKVPANQVENRGAYEYWVDGNWTQQMPSLGQEGINITDSNAGGQGTYYWSEPWQSFVWIGGCPFPGAAAFITTAPHPSGPWIKPFQFYEGTGGNHALPAYSIQAHPGLLSSPNQHAIYLTYTKSDEGAYTTPLVYVEWE